MGFEGKGDQRNAVGERFSARSFQKYGMTAMHAVEITDCIYCPDQLRRNLTKQMSIR